VLTLDPRCALLCAPELLNNIGDRAQPWNAPDRSIPIWYRVGMSKQIAVRLPEQLVEFIDERVQEGSAPSRAAVVAQALERERRRALAEQDAVILCGVDEHDEMDALAAYAAEVQLDDLE
jgi:Arc/MetJ-type ribon-helix-helix transcriptional regulator